MRISDWSSDVCSSDLARSRNVLRIGQHSATGQQKTMALNQAKQVFLTAYIGIQAAYAETRIGAQVAQRHGMKPLGTSQPQGRVDDTHQIFNRNLLFLDKDEDRKHTRMKSRH